ncbi:MAG: CHC2 zinc finger domain-containing protein [Anaerolineae bacterium]
MGTPPPPHLTGQMDVFFGVHPIAWLPEGAYTPTTRGRIDTVAAVNALFADLDGKAFDAADPRGRGLQMARQHIASLPSQPSLLVLSGGGYHGYWLLGEPWVLLTEEDRQRAAGLQAAWVRQVGGDPGCKDLARILRVPGTANAKYPGRPTVAVVAWHPHKLYTVEELQAACRGTSTAVGPEKAATPGGAEHALLTAVLGALDRGDCPSAKWPDRTGDYWPLCPFHADKHSGSFSVGPKGYFCFACGAKGSLEELDRRVRAAAPVHLCSATQGDGPNISFASGPLQAYAAAKHLEVARLQEYGLCDRRYQGALALYIPYLDRAGKQVATRYRTSLDGKDGFRRTSGSRVIPYGLWRLNDAPAIILVEGESDCHTLWQYGLPALGIPGANTWDPAWAEYLQGKRVYVWQEPDQGGQAFARAVGLTLPEARLLVAPSGRKDMSACHLCGDDLPALLARLMETASTFTALRTGEDQQRAEEARQQAGALIECPDILAKFSALCSQLGLVGEERNGRLLFLALVSRLLPEPVSLVIKGPSSGGKSFLLKVALQAFPESAYLDFTA